MMMEECRMNKCTEDWIDGSMNARMDESMDECMDTYMDE